MVVVLACLALASARPSIHGDHGVILRGPSGVITHAGPIGPSDLAHVNYGHYYGDEGHYNGADDHYDGDDGHYPGDDDDGSYHGEGAGVHSGIVATHSATIIAPGAGHGVGYQGAHAYGHGYFGAPVLGYGYGGHGHASGYVGVGVHGVTVHGPNTVPAVVAGPSGSITADGLYGVPHHSHHY